MLSNTSSVEKEGVYQAAKWLKLPMLIDGAEMQHFFDSLGTCWIFQMAGLTEGRPISTNDFVGEYTEWIEDLKQGIVPTDERLRRLLASALTDDLDALWLQPVAGQYLVKMRAPVVQMQAHFVHFSSVDGEFRSMSMGKESIFWGVQCAFPQVYQNPKTMEICEVEEMPFFRKMQLWARENTRATPFVVNGQRKNVPIRLGKKCFSWASQHPQLKEKGLAIHG